MGPIMGELPSRKPPDTLGHPMRYRNAIAVFSVFALLCATSQYLAHFHVPRADGAAGVAAEKHLAAPGHAAERCALCLQFDRLPAPPAAERSLAGVYFFVGAITPTIFESHEAAPRALWPPSRGPPTFS
jgi:hypothetical protein